MVSTFDFRRISTTQAMQFFQLLRVGAAVLVSIVLAKSGLDTADIGAWEMLLYLSTTLTFFWVNGLLQGIAPTYARLGDDARKVFIFNSFIVFCGLSAILFSGLIFGEKWLVPVLTGQARVPHFGLFCGYLLLHLPSFPVEYFYLLRGRPWHIVAWGVAIFGLHVAALFVPLQLGWGLGSSIATLCVLAALKFVWTLGLVRRWGRWRFDAPLLHAYLRFCGPLMLSTLVSNFMLLFDNWLVNWHFRDAAIFAVYRYGSREFPLATALTSALGTALIPTLATALPAGLEALKTKSRRLMHLLFPLTIALLFASKTLFPLVFNADFEASAGLFNIYLLTLASRVLLPASVLLAQGDSRSIFRVSLLEMAVKTALGFLFIQQWGLPGLAWSVVLAFWVEKIGLIFILEKKHQVRTSDWLDLRCYAGYVAALAVAFWLAA
jgi:O-antigen/teichoic acid export membrane protein